MNFLTLERRLTRIFNKFKVPNHDSLGVLTKAQTLEECSVLVNNDKMAREIWETILNFRLFYG